MITWAKEEWIPMLKKLWKLTFHDEDKYIDFYFNRRFRKDNMLVDLSEKGEIMAMASLLPARLWEEKGGRLLKTQAYYIYAVATEPAFQGRGISSRLLAYLKRFIENQNAVGILVPGEESLIGFYEKRGFYQGPLIGEYCLWQQDMLRAAQIKHKEKASFFKASPKEYKESRDNTFGRPGYVEWNVEAVAYAMAENQFAGGLCGRLEFHGLKGMVMGYCREREFVVLESTVTPNMWNEWGEAVGEALGCERIILKGLLAMNTRCEGLEGYFNLPLG